VVPEVSAESVAVSDAFPVFAEVSVSAVGAFASVAVPEVLPVSVAVSDASGAAAAEDGAASVEAGGARSSARAVWAKNDAQTRAASSAAMQPRTRGQRTSARTATRFCSTALPSRWRQSCFRASEYLHLTRATQVAY
jgi:hypothetical protein